MERAREGEMKLKDDGRFRNASVQEIQQAKLLLAKHALYAEKTGDLMFAGKCAMVAFAVGIIEQLERDSQ